MAALPEPEYGVDPETMQEMPMPPELMEAMGDPGVDPGAPAADPMLQQEPDDDEYDGLEEVEYREKVELCVLAAIETAAKAVEVGVGSANPQFAAQFGQACASLGQCYEALTRSEQAEQDDGPSTDPLFT